MQPSPSRRRYAVVGTGGRSQMYLEALATTHADVGVVSALVDGNEVRMAYYEEFLAAAGQDEPPRRYRPEQFDDLLRHDRPDAVIVTSPDHTHARYVVAALDAGVDVVCEKPLTIDAESLRAIVEAARTSTADLVVTFNYRYSPRNSALRRVITDGRIGEVTSVHFEWCLDTVHGADYFRRWHREKANSGGLLVHKSTHHFDLVNWWIDDAPETVFALGGLRFYGAANAARRGLGPRPELGRAAVGQGDPFVLDLAADDKLRRLFLEGEALDGYHRDRDVFTDGITIEDNLTLAVGYSRGASMAYTLNAHSPWEGYRVAVNGTRGRVELEVVERSHVDAVGLTSGGDPGKSAPVVDPSATPDDSEAAAQSLRPWGSRLLLQEHWQPPQVVPIPEGAGSHGGGDAVLLDDVLRGASDDPLHRRAGYLDGVRSVLVGVAGNASLASGRAVGLAEFGLPLRAEEVPA
ncbi:Gfo/Idh/MocA family protein [Kineococcus rhizosphaerae]|uniref:Gfo/Idh/MocA family protein n=1 Tax=Kineococcus rhizosphaerae TaxID=559628 RepID=UPI001FE41980|nr:Gfo/Idh/MocA family oxidoreductase [Kineococcus rhizosphaerae]